MRPLIPEMPGTAATRAPPDVPAAAWAQASCVAALQAQSESLAGLIKAGQPELTELLRLRLRAAAAFIGQAYLDGERDEVRSKALLRQARQAQQALSASELIARQDHCAALGSQLLADTNALGRMVVHRVAERRLHKLLGR